MKHKLRVERKVFPDPETVGIIFRVLSKFLALLTRILLKKRFTILRIRGIYQANKHTIQPAKNIWSFIGIGAEGGQASHKDSCCFLIEASGDVRQIRNGIRPVTRYSCYSYAFLSARVLVLCNKLDVATSSLRYRCPVLFNEAKIN